jgi:DNA-binding NtrC family response regulator
MSQISKIRVFSSKQPTVLVVDPDPFVGRIIRNILQEEQINVILTKDSSEAMAALRTGKHVDLIVSEWLLPNCSGQQLALKARKRRPRLNTVFVSALYNVILPRLECAQAEGLQKPFAPEELLSLIAPHLQPRREDLAQKKWSA